MKERHFTVTTYVLHDGKTLLIRHPKFQKWMPPGGHLEQNETPHEGAEREVLEETGLAIEFIADERLYIDSSHAISLPRPHFCLLEQVPAFGDKPSHEHIDLIFLARPIDLTVKGEPVHPMRWFSWEEIEELGARELFEDSLHILKSVMGKT